MTADRTIHVGGKACPYPLLDVTAALADMVEGQVLEVATDRRACARYLLPRYCARRGLPVTSSGTAGDWRLAITVGKPALATGPAAPRLSMRGVAKTFSGRRGQTMALADVNLHVSEGELVCVVGPSGCGKTTLLNLIAGLERPDAGQVLCNGGPVRGPGPDRLVIFQEAALFPWLTVQGNVEFGLRMAGVEPAVRRELALDYLDMVHLRTFAKSCVHELSGGMKQRVAIARALAMDPDVLLMDEPFSALDAQTREMLHDELQAIQGVTHRTIVFITHNVREAVVLADRVLLMSARPGTVRRDYAITAPRPRSVGDRRLMELAGEIREALGAEVAQLRREEMAGA